MYESKTKASSIAMPDKPSATPAPLPAGAPVVDKERYLAAVQAGKAAAQVSAKAAFCVYLDKVVGGLVDEDVLVTVDETFGHTALRCFKNLLLEVDATLTATLLPADAGRPTRVLVSPPVDLSKTPPVPEKAAAVRIPEPSVVDPPAPEPVDDPPALVPPTTAMLALDAFKGSNADKLGFLNKQLEVVTEDDRIWVRSKGRMILGTVLKLRWTGPSQGSVQVVFDADSGLYESVSWSSGYVSWPLKDALVLPWWQDCTALYKEHFPELVFLEAHPGGVGVKVNDFIRVQDTYNEWMLGQVLGESTTHVYVKYIGYVDKWNEWISRDSARLGRNIPVNRRCVTALSISDNVRVLLAAMASTLLSLDLSSLVSRLGSMRKWLEVCHFDVYQVSTGNRRTAGIPDLARVPIAVIDLGDVRITVMGPSEGLTGISSVPVPF